MGPCSYTHSCIPPSRHSLHGIQGTEILPHVFNFKILWKGERGEAETREKELELRNSLPLQTAPPAGPLSSSLLLILMNPHDKPRA